MTVTDTGAFIDFRDTRMTRENLADSTYMFGSPVSVDEADGCAPARYNAREVARHYYRLRGRELGVVKVTVIIGSKAVQASHFFYLDELEPPTPGARRLTGSRGQPELASAQGNACAACLRGQSDALALPVLDTASQSIAAVTDARR